LINKSVASSERKWVFRFAILVLLITTIPYWIGFNSAGEAWRFTGFVFGVEDGNSYIGKMLSGAAGSWLFRTPYTSSQQEGFLAFLPYILLGKLTTSPGQHEQLVALFHLFRIGASFIFLFATYDFIALFLERPGWRKVALIFITFGGGIGWIFLILFGEGNRLPLEFYSPETFGFLSLYGIPHLAAARALLLWGLVFYLLPYSIFSRMANSIAGGLAWLLLGFFQPLTVVIGWVVLAAHLICLGGLRYIQNRKTGLGEWDDWKRYFRKAVIIGLVSLPLVLHTMISFVTDPFLRGWGSQNLILSPPPMDYILAYALLLPFTLLGIPAILKEFPLKGPLLLGWLAALPFLAYAPYNLQRRLPEGGWVVIVILGVFFLQYWQRAGRRAVAVLLFLSVIPSLILIAGGSMEAARPGEPIFQPAERVFTFDFLREYATPSDVILAGYSTSNALPAWAPMRVVAGHGPESVGLKTLQPRIEQFYRSEMKDEESVEFLRKMQVKFVFWGPEEVKLSGESSNGWHPDDADYLEHVYTQGDYQIYKVRENIIVSP
jgi:hypothetical protein